jgi:ABC-type multidrug transport system fused ATPase/permease subunit
MPDGLVAFSQGIIQTMSPLIKSQKLRNSVFFKSFAILPKNDQPKLIAVTILQIGLNVLDLVGVAMIGLIGALAVQGVQSVSPTGRVQSILTTLHLENLSFQAQAGALGTIAVFLLVCKTVLSILINRRILFFLSRRGANVSSQLMAKLMSQSLLEIQESTIQQKLYSITQGVSAVTLGVLGVTVLLVSDVSLILVIAIGLFIVDPVIAILTVIIFSIVGFALYKFMHQKAMQLGATDARLNIASSEKIVEVLTSYRESVVRNRRSYYAREVEKMRLEISETLAELSMMPSISKYIVETTLVVAGLIISAIQFLVLDASHAVATLAIFIAAGSRLAPAALRVQQGAIQIKRNMGAAIPTLELVDEMQHIKPVDSMIDELFLEHPNFEGSVNFKEVNFIYPGTSEFAVKDFTLQIMAGSTVAFVGSSGAGKTTLIDLLLGVLTPNSGEIYVSNTSSSEAIKKWPGAISYVPQDVTVVNGTVKQNICLGYPEDSAPDDWYWEILEKVGLKEFFSGQEHGLDTRVGERGGRLSGGQRQRLGIARGLFTNPKLLILDEATSALDGETEAKITRTLESLAGKVTICVIAHRLSSIRNADLVAYMSKGHLIETGKFEEVRKAVPDFDYQAKQMGL